MRKSMYIIALTLLLVFSNMIIGATANEIELDFPSWQVTAAGLSDWWEALVEDFENEHPNVKINLYQVPFTDYVTTITTRFGASNPPDILHMPSYEVLGFIDLGWIKSLDTRLKDTDILENWTDLQNKLKQNGKQYGVLLLGYGYSLYYNEKMLEEAGVSVPTTMEEFYNAAEKLTVDTNNDGNIDQYGFGMITTTHPDLYKEAMNFVRGYGGAFTKDGKITTDDPGVIKGLRMIDELAKNNLIPMGLNSAQKRSFFFEGKVAMMIDGPWALPMRKDSNPEIAKYIKVAVPFTNSGNISGGISNSIHIPEGISDEKEELVWQFIYKITRPEWQIKFMQLSISPAPRKGLESEEILKEIPEMEIFMKCLDMAVDPLPSGYETQYTLFSRILIDAVMRVITTDESVESILDRLGNELKMELE